MGGVMTLPLGVKTFDGTGDDVGCAVGWSVVTGLRAGSS